MTTRRISLEGLMNMGETKYYSRKWLNKKTGTAFIECSSECELSSYKDFSFKISDCNKSVTIDLSFHDKKGKAERLNKVSLIIDELTAFKAAMEKVEVKK